MTRADQQGRDGRDDGPGHAGAADRSADGRTAGKAAGQAAKAPAGKTAAKTAAKKATKKAAKTAAAKKGAKTAAGRQPAKPAEKESPAGRPSRRSSGGSGPREDDRMAQVMHEFKEGELKSGSTGKPVKSRRQAVAIGLSEGRREGEPVTPPPRDGR